MPSFTQLLSEAQNLAGDAANVADLQDLIDELVGALLVLEGPPVEPIPGLSEDVRTAIVRSVKGRNLTVAKTWITGPWRCLLLESPSVPMGRPMFIPRDPELLQKKTAKRTPLSPSDFRMITPWKTKKAISRIVDACPALGISSPIGEGAVHIVAGADRTFLAWRARAFDEPFSALPGDIDNYSKTGLDGLQAAGVLPNDKGVVRLSAVKDLPPSWTEPPRPLEEAIRNEIVTRRERGQDLETIRAEMRLSRVHMAALFPGEYTPRNRRKDPAAITAAARTALELIKAGTPYRKALRETHANAGAVRPLLAEHLRPRVLQDEQLSLHALSQELRLDARTTAAIFRHDAEALELLRMRSRSRKARARGRSSNEMIAAAIADIQGGMSAPEAARKHDVSVGYLRVKLDRLKKKAQPTRPADR